MILGLNAFGISEFNTAIPSKRTHNQVKFYGNARIDNVHIQNIELTFQQIKEIYSLTSNQVRTTNTVLLADFNLTLEAGEFDNSGMLVTNWHIYRRKIGESIFRFIADVPYVSNGVDFYDYTAQNGVEYEYEIKIVSNGIEGNGKTGVGILDFFGWILCDKDEDIIYKFDIELESTDINTVRDLTIYDNYSEKPAFRYGKKKYRQGGLSTMPVTYNVENNDCEFTLETLEGLREFINSPSVKTLKNAKGEIIFCVTQNFKYKYMDKISKQPYTISFDFTEVK